jgi:hypothetical protein
MKLIENIKTTTYAEGDFRIDITETEDMFEAYIYHVAYGVKNHIIGCPKKQPNGDDYDYDKFLDTIRWNIWDDIKFYIEDVIEKDYC